MFKQIINLENKSNNPLSKNKITLTLVFAIFIYSIAIIGSTYAYISISANNNQVSGQGGCFQVSYTGQELNAGNINSTIEFNTSETGTAANTTVTLSKASTCKIYTEANIHLKINDITTIPIIDTPALKYKILEQNTNKQVGEGLITNKGDNILTTVPITETATTYVIYFWIDVFLSNGQYHDKTFSGYIYADSAQTSTIENQYLVNFNTNGGTQLEPKSVTYGSTYSDLSTPTKDGYTFQGWSLVPDEYQQVEYIESSGTQYINTEIVPSNTTGIYAKLSSSNISSDLIYFGSKGSGNSRFWIGNTSSQAYFGWNSVLSPKTSISSGTAFTIKMNYLNDRTTSINNTTKNTGITTLASNTYPIYIFAGNNAGTASNKSSIKLYELSISKDNIIIANLIPCYKKTDPDHPGLYDTVTGKFYGNAGTGNFTAGASKIITTSSEVTEARNHTLYAVWQPRTYTVTFNANGGTVSTQSKQVEYGSPYGELPIPTRSGYTFKGWNGKNKAVPLTSANYNVTNYQSNNIIDFKQEGDIYYANIKGPSSYKDTNWIIATKNKFSLNSGSYSLSFMARSKNSTVTQYIAKKSGNTDGKIGIYRNDSSISNIISTIENNLNFDNNGNWYFLSSPIALNSNETNAIIAIGNDNPNIYGANSYIDIANIQLEEGTTATIYEPYYVTSNVNVTQAKNHTLTAIWEQN